MRIRSSGQCCCDVELSRSRQQPLTDALFRALGLTLAYSPDVNEDALRVSQAVGRAKAKRIAALLTETLPLLRDIFVLQKSDKPVSQPLRHHTVDISPGFAEKNALWNNQIAFLLLPGAAELRMCTIHINETVCEENAIRLPAAFSLSDDSKPALLLPKPLLFTVVKAQRATHIKADTVSVNSELYRQLQALAPTGLAFRHLATGATMTRRLSFVEGSDELAPNQIRLNYYQREILNIIDRPKAGRSPSYVSKLCSKVLRTHPDENGYFAKEQDKQTISELYNQIQVVPVYIHGKRRRSLLRTLCDLMVGGCEMRLSAVRPYKLDDARDIIRLSEDTMTLLGIEETDRVIVQHKGCSCKASAMRIDSFALMEETNIVDAVTDLDLVVGIPAPLRKQLDIGDIETEVTVKRDTVFLFSKSLNVQMLSVLGLLIAVFQIGEESFLLKCLICIALLPIIIYTSLSRERSRVKKFRQRSKDEGR